MELLLTFNIVVTIVGFSFMAWSQRDTRQILREQKELLDRYGWPHGPACGVQSAYR